MPGIHRSVALAIENAPVEMTQYMHDEIDRKWNADVGGILLGFMQVY